MDKIGMDDLGPDGGMLTVLGMYEAYHQSDQTNYRTYVKHVHSDVIAIGAFNLLIALSSICDEPFAFLAHLSCHDSTGRSSAHRARTEILESFDGIDETATQCDLTMSLTNHKPGPLIAGAISCVDTAMSCLTEALLDEAGVAPSRPARANQRRKLIARVRADIMTGTGITDGS